MLGAPPMQGPYSVAPFLMATWPPGAEAAAGPHPGSSTEQQYMHMQQSGSYAGDLATSVGPARLPPAAHARAPSQSAATLLMQQPNLEVHQIADSMQQ